MLHYLAETFSLNYWGINRPKVQYLPGNAGSLGTDQEITRLLCNRMVHYSVHTNLYFHYILSQFNPALYSF